MSFEVIAMGREYSQKQESDIVEVSDGVVGLRIVVIAAVDTFNSIYVEYHFRHPRGYRFLDEGDLLRYWDETAFNTGHHLYEIRKGGWLTGEFVESGVLSVSQESGAGEWFIATSNGCMNVISADAPFIREISEH